MASKQKIGDVLVIIGLSLSSAGITSIIFSRQELKSICISTLLNIPLFYIAKYY